MSSVPRFSVIVPVYQAQAHLHACLESVLSQSFMDLELIAVDDGSPDACGAIVDEFAARDPRVRAVHLAESRGRGGARDAGLDRARGDYLLFLDGEDTLTPDALFSIETRLKETGEPDVLVYGLACTDRAGRAVPDDVTGTPAAAWNKACRRDFVEREGLTFPAGRREDTPWTCPALPAAESIATLDRVCVHHRQRRQDGDRGATSRRHGGVFERYEQGYDRGYEAYDRVFARRRRTAGVRLPLRPRLRPALVRLGPRPAFRALRWALTLRRRTAKLVVKSLRALRGVLLRAYHRIRPCLPPRADRAMPPAGRRRGHGCAPGALGVPEAAFAPEAAFRTYAPHLRPVWTAEPEHHPDRAQGQRAGRWAIRRRVRPGCCRGWRWSTGTPGGPARPACGRCPGPRCRAARCAG